MCVRVCGKPGVFMFVCQFALVLWVLTYIGGWFNGMTLLIVGQH